MRARLREDDQIVAGFDELAARRIKRDRENPFRKAEAKRHKKVVQMLIAAVLVVGWWVYLITYGVHP